MKTRQRIGLQHVRALNPGETIWDATVAGFGARRQRSEAVAYVVLYRTKQGRPRWFTIGRHGAPWTPDMAREEAKRLLGKVASGEDPSTAKQTSRHAKTVAELCDLYLADAEAGRLLTRRKQPKKSSTLVTDRGRIVRHIKPLLGRLPVAAITRSDIDGFMHDVAAGKTANRIKTKSRGLANVRGGKGTASRTIGLLGGIFSYAVRHRMRADNPVHGVTRFADGKRERRISDAEYAVMGAALRAAEADGMWPALIAAIRYLAITGWRRGEVLGLRWSEIDLSRHTASLADTKTGVSIRPLGHHACEILKSMRRTGDLVFAATRGDGPMTGFPKMWTKLFSGDTIPKDVTPHVLRHSFASLASDLGYSDSTIAALLGHKGRTITSRYVHSADQVLIAAADAVASRTVELMAELSAEKTVIHLRRV